MNANVRESLSLPRPRGPAHDWQDAGNGAGNAANDGTAGLSGRQDEPHGVGFAQACGVWARVAALSFGGPAGQIAAMHRLIVEERRWISDERFLHALNYCMLLPGPEAMQLATYIGWLMHRARGGLVAGLLFVLPGAVAIWALSVVYALYGKVGFVAAAFFGVKAAVLAIVAQAVQRVGARALKHGALRALAAAAFVAIFFFAAPYPLIIATAALIGFAGARFGASGFAGGAGVGAGKVAAVETRLGDVIPEHAKPSRAGFARVVAIWAPLWLAPSVALALTLGPDHVFSQIAVFFSKMAAVTFGGAYAVLAYVAQQAVERYHWLAPNEMLDGLGLAETTPGPLIMVLQFVGFLAAYRSPGALPPLVAGALGGFLATWVTFTPCFLWIFAGAPYIETLRHNRALTGALSAITAAVVGVISNLAVWFAVHSLFRETVAVRRFGLAFDAPRLGSLDPWALALTLAAFGVLFRFRFGMLSALAAAAVAGLVLYLLGAPLSL